MSLNINSNKEYYMNQYEQFMQVMLLKIRKKCQEFQMEVEQLQKYIEQNKDHWKISLLKELEIKVGCVLELQLQKPEIDGLEVNEARDEIIRIKNFCQLINNQPLFPVTNMEENHVDSTTFQLSFPTLIKDRLKLIEEFVMEHSFEAIKQPDRYQTHIEKQTVNRKSDGAYPQYLFEYPPNLQNLQKQH